MNDSHVILEVAVLIYSVSHPCSANKSLCVQAPKNHIVVPFQANQVFHVFNLLLIGIYVAVVHVLNSVAPRLVSTSLRWLVRYILSSHISCVPQCRVNGEFCGHCVECLLGPPVPFSIH